jgi:hypothetical protein
MGPAGSDAQAVVVVVTGQPFRQRMLRTIGPLRRRLHLISLPKTSPTTGGFQHGGAGKLFVIRVGGRALVVQKELRIFSSADRLKPAWPAFALFRDSRTLTFREIAVDASRIASGLN